jgi:hypothetical protein
MGALCMILRGVAAWMLLVRGGGATSSTHIRLKGGWPTFGVRQALSLHTVCILVIVVVVGISVNIGPPAGFLIHLGYNDED